MPIVLSGATSGSTTVQATDAVTATLTLPSATGTLVSTASPASGNVIQVVNATFSTTTSMTSTTYTNSGLTVSITPKFSNSTILISAHITGIYVNDAGNFLKAKLVRNSTDITTDFSNVAGGYNGSTGNIGAGTVSVSYMDSPATTSATTYKVQVASTSNSQTVYWSNGNSLSTITVMEIAA